MGVPPAWRKMLVELLKRRGAAPPCSYAVMPTEGPGVPPAFDIVLVDLMQDLAMVKHGGPADEARTGSDLGGRIKRTLYNHLNTGGTDGELQAHRLLIGCMDNHYIVPRNKSFVQGARDAVASASASAGGDADGGDEDGGGGGGGDRDEGISAVIDASDYAVAVARARATEAQRVYDAVLAEQRNGGETAERVRREVETTFSDRTHFLVGAGALPVEGVRVWRSMALRWQLTRFITEGVLSMNVPPGVLMLLDEGLPLNAQRYAELRASMVADHTRVAGSYSPFDDAVLVGNLMGSCFRRVLVRPGNIFCSMPTLGIGESDNKILYYVQRTPPMGLDVRSMTRPGRISYLVKCQDTDVMWQLLMHVRTLINPATGQVDDVDLWMDTQTPNDRARGVSQEYRFINIVAMWRQLLDLMHAEFPTVRNPLETLFFFVFCNANDYVEPLPPTMKIGPGKLWTLMAASLALLAQHDTYPMGSGAKPRAKVSPALPDRVAALVGDLVVAQERPIDMQTDTMVLDADADAEAPKAGAGDPMELTPRSASVATAVRPHDAPVFLRCDRVLRLFYYLVQTSPLVRNLVKKYKGTQWAGILDSYVADPDALMEAIVGLEALARSDLASDSASQAAILPLFGIPTVAAMKARVARIEWTMNYYLNGWKTPEYLHNWFAHDGEFSLHGWTRVDVTNSMSTNPNSQYLFAEYVHPCSEDDVGTYRYYRAERADEVKSSPY